MATMSSTEYKGVVTVELRLDGSVGFMQNSLPGMTESVQAMLHIYLPHSAESAS